MSDSKRRVPQSISLNREAKYSVPVIANPSSGCPAFLPHPPTMTIQPTVAIYNTGDIDIITATFVLAVDRGTTAGNLCFIFFSNKKVVAVIELPATPPPPVMTTSYAFTTDKLACREVLSVAVS